MYKKLQKNSVQFGHLKFCPNDCSQELKLLNLLRFMNPYHWSLVGLRSSWATHPLNTLLLLEVLFNLVLLKTLSMNRCLDNSREKYNKFPGL